MTDAAAALRFDAMLAQPAVRWSPAAFGSYSDTPTVPMFRPLGPFPLVLQQLWRDPLTGAEEWRDVPVEENKE